MIPSDLGSVRPVASRTRPGAEPDDALGYAFQTPFREAGFGSAPAGHHQRGGSGSRSATAAISP